MENYGKITFEIDVVDQIILENNFRATQSWCVKYQIPGSTTIHAHQCNKSKNSDYNMAVV